MSAMFPAGRDRLGRVTYERIDRMSGLVSARATYVNRGMWFFAFPLMMQIDVHDWHVNAPTVWSNTLVTVRQWVPSLFTKKGKVATVTVMEAETRKRMP